MKFLRVSDDRFVSEDGCWSLTSSSRRKGWTVSRAKGKTSYGVMAWEHVDFVAGSRAEAEKLARASAKKK